MNRSQTLTRFALAIVLSGMAPSLVRAHFNMLLPQSASARVGESTTLLYQWGHPFEHQLFDAPQPKELVALSPSGKRIDLTRSLTAIKVPSEEGKQVTAYQLRFTPEERGDYLFTLLTPPIWMEEDREFLQDTVKVTLHVQAQNGWDRAAGSINELVPLTRPYALQPGMVVRAQALSKGNPSAGALVEIERYQSTARKDLPPDEFRTYTAKTDAGGIVTCTLPDPGWWCLTAHGEKAKLEREGKPFPLRQRTTLWLFVDEMIKVGK